jgi:hypothetical protein
VVLYGSSLVQEITILSTIEEAVVIYESQTRKFVLVAAFVALMSAISLERSGDEDEAR